MTEREEAAPLHIALGEADFAALVRGEVAEATGSGGRTVRVILSDIGWGRMFAAVETAMRERMHAALEVDTAAMKPMAAEVSQVGAVYKVLVPLPGKLGDSFVGIEVLGIGEECQAKVVPLPPISEGT